MERDEFDDVVTSLASFTMFGHAWWPAVSATSALRRLADPALADREQDWIQAVLTDPVRQQDAMAKLRQRFPFVARLEHRPEGVRPADARSYGERTAGLPDAQLIAGFLEHVRAGAGPSDAESSLVAEVLTAVQAAERAA